MSLEASYTMMSVALDEAMRLRADGQLVQARAQAGVCGELGERLARKVGILIHGMKEHGEKMPVLPVVLPLIASNFRHVAWQELDYLHYDLNTCLREAIVTMKCFLRGMPEDLFAVFQQQLRGIPTTPAEEQAAKLIGTKSAQRLAAQLITPFPPRY
ncbi:MAG: hypothetical protein HY012_03540 [Acidobacteria bacterium]|nr:hypothetical protein [Acidobacteriota bacterium]